METVLSNFTWLGIRRRIYRDHTTYHVERYNINGSHVQKIIRHEQISQINADNTKTIITEEDDDLLMHHLDHFKKVKAW